MNWNMKISGLQVFWIMMTFEIGNTLLLTMTASAQEAKQDAWISMFIAGLGGILITFIATTLGLLYPNQTLIQFSKRIVGKWFGVLIIIPFFVQWYSEMAIVTREFSEFIIISLFRSTPLWVIIITISVLLVYIVYLGGIESIGRCSEIIGPIVLVMIALILVLDLGNCNWHRILPIYADSGWRPILQGALFPMSFYSESVIMLMLIAFMDNSKRAQSRVMLAIGVSAFVVFVSTLFVLFTFGPALVSKMTYPFYDVARFISILNFIQNIDVVVVILWFTSVFIKLSVYLFVSCYGTAEWLGIRDWRKFLWILAPMVVILAICIPDVQVVSVEYYGKMYWVPYVFTINFLGIPIFLLVIGLFRKKLHVQNR
ncbi:GerAB/ArcD/ProY family transporter [Alicyclobacillus fodiniaquatilis]|uniref:Endospore germination permease n=1 Tax=Alicyclobacillus fodiniaquatilis TaxID=1661150 RepID=A0ABW4JKQ5_9BACL